MREFLDALWPLAFTVGVVLWFVGYGTSLGEKDGDGKALKKNSDGKARALHLLHAAIAALLIAFFGLYYLYYHPPAPVEDPLKFHQSSEMW